jgi:predicted permease
MRPPPLLRALLRLAAPSEQRADLVAGLDEEFAHRAAADPRAAGRWYRRQVLRSIGPLVSRRLPGLAPAMLARGLGQDLRLALRSLASSRGFTASAVLMLTVGIGAHTVVSAIVDALLLRPLPYGERSPRLVTLQSIHPTLSPDWRDAEMSYADFVDLRRETAAFDGLEAVIGRNLSIAAGDDAVRVLAASVTPGTLRLLGEAPALGRDFRDDEAAEPGFEQVAIVGHRVWETLLGADPSAVGRTIRVNERPVTVVGVMPPGFMFPDEHQMWLPYRGREDAGRANRGFLVLGLLKPGVSVAAATGELNGAAARLARQYPETNRDWSVHVAPLRDAFVTGGDIEQMLGAVSLLLFVACANVAGLFVARGLSRQHELRLRAALGAGRARLIRLLVTESVIVSVVSGALGLAAAGSGLRLLMAWIPEPLPYWAQPAIDARVALFAIWLTGGVVLASGLVPALRISRVQAAASLAPGTRVASAVGGHRRLQHALVAGQVAMSLVLLTGAVLLGRSTTALLEADAGFDRSAILSTRFYIAGDRYDPIEARAAAVRDVVRLVGDVPGVRAAAATGSIPSDDGGATVRIRSPRPGAAADEAIGAQMISVTPEFWDALGLSLDAGRTFSAIEADSPETDAAIVNRRLARALWPGEDAVGRVLTVETAAGPIDARIVGVAPDLVYEEFGEETPQSQLNVYVPYIRSGSRTQALLIRADGDPAVLAERVRLAVRGVDPGFAVYDTMTMDDRRAYNHWSDAFVGRTFWTFAVAALLLACVGAYAISAYGVVQRRREIGVRLAIGARRVDILTLFLGAGLRVAVVGACIGLPLAVAVARVLESDLFRVSPWEPRLWIALPVTLVAAVLAASYLPARRASLSDPALTLRD